MAWVEPTEVTTGDVLTAAKWNQDVVANMVALGGAWESFSASWSNLTVGNGTEAAAYIAVGKLYMVRYGLTFGSTSAMGTEPTLTLPNSSSFATGMQIAANQVGHATMLDTGTTTYAAAVQYDTSTTVRLRAYNAASTYLQAIGTPAASVPFTWTTGDVLTLQFVYEAA